MEIYIFCRIKVPNMLRLLEIFETDGVYIYLDYVLLYFYFYLYNNPLHAYLLL